MNIKRIRNFKAFTLIELLVVIAIIGLLATLSLIYLHRARMQARDAKRLSDMTILGKALELYFNDAGVYPSNSQVTSGQGLSYAATSTASSTLYLDAIPVAPETADGECTDYSNSYYYDSKDGSSYGLNFCLGQPLKEYTPGPKCLTNLGIENKACGPIMKITTYGGSYTDWSYSIIASGDYLYSAGITRSERAGYQDAMIAKYNRHTLQFEKAKLIRGGNDNNTGFLGGAMLTDDNYIYAIGRSSADGFGSTDVLLIKYDNDLNVVAKKIFGTQYLDTCSGTGMDDNYIYMACFYYTTSSTSGNSDMALLKVDKNNLDIVAEKRFYIDTVKKDQSNTLEIVNDKLYLTGISYTSSAYYSGFLMEFDKDFNYLRGKYLLLSEGRGSALTYMVSDGQYLYISSRPYRASDSSGDGGLLKVRLSDLGVERSIYFSEPGTNSGGRLFLLRGDIYQTGMTSVDPFGNVGGAIKVINADSFNVLSNKTFGSAGGDDLFNDVVYYDGHLYGNGSSQVKGSGNDDQWVVDINTVPPGVYQSSPSGFKYVDSQYGAADLPFQSSDVVIYDQPGSVGHFSIRDSILNTNDSPSISTQGPVYIFE